MTDSKKSEADIIVDLLKQAEDRTPDERVKVDNIDEVLKEKQKEVQGNYSHGKVSEEDDGDLMAAVFSSPDKKVILKFPHPVTWIGMPPEMAINLARILIVNARECGFKGPISITLG